MENLKKAIYSKAVGSAFLTAIAGRFHDTEAPQGSEFPYTVYKVVIDIKVWDFKERYEDALIQFSIFSSDLDDSTEINDIYTKLNTVYDESLLNITGARSIWMWKNNLTTLRDEITTPEGTVGVWAYHVDYDCFYEQI